MRWASIATALIALLALPGCSFLFMDRVPDDYAERPAFTCTTNRALPALDLYAAAVTGLTGALFLAFADAFDGSADSDASIIALLFFGPAAILGTSSAVGFYQGGDCEDAMDVLEHRARQRRAEAMSASPSTAGGEPTLCSFDTQCEGSRICVANRCVDAPPRAESTPPSNIPTPVLVTP